MAGEQGAPFTMHVELGKIREFARAVRSSHPEYLEHDRPVVPPTFLITSAFWSGPEHSPPGMEKLDLTRLLHGEQEFVFHGEPPRAGDVLTASSRIDRVYEKEGKRGGTMTFTEMVTEFRDASGRLVAESRGTSIVTSRATTEQ